MPSKTFLIHLSFLILSAIHCHSTAMTAEKCKRKPPQKRNRQLKNHVFTTFELVPDIGICQEACDYMKECHSANFIEKRKICELNNATHLSTKIKENFVVNKDSVYFMYRNISGENDDDDAVNCLYVAFGHFYAL